MLPSVPALREKCPTLGYSKVLSHSNWRRSTCSSVIGFKSNPNSFCTRPRSIIHIIIVCVCVPPMVITQINSMCSRENYDIQTGSTLEQDRKEAALLCVLQLTPFARLLSPGFFLVLELPTMRRFHRELTRRMPVIS